MLKLFAQFYPNISAKSFGNCFALRTDVRLMGVTDYQLSTLLRRATCRFMELKLFKTHTNKSALVSMDSNILLIQWTTDSQQES